MYLFMGKKSPCSVNGFEQLGGQKGWVEWWAEWRGHFGESVYKKTCHHIFSEEFSYRCKYDQKLRIGTESLISDEWMEQVGLRMWAVGTEWVGESENSIASSPPHRLAHPPIFEIICNFNAIWVNKIWQLQQEQMQLHVVASKLFFCGKWNLVCKFPGKPTGPGVWWNQTKPARLPSYRGQSGRMGGLIWKTVRYFVEQLLTVKWRFEQWSILLMEYAHC